MARTKTPTNTQPLVLTVPQAARALQVTPQHIYNEIRRGHLRTVLIGASRRVPRSEVERLAGTRDEVE